MFLIISVGKYGGFYIYPRRLCLGFLSFTVYYGDYDVKIESFMDYLDRKRLGVL